MGIEEVMIGEDKLLRFSGVARAEACSIVLRGATKQILDEAERSLHDALKTAGKESVAMESFAHALLQIPTTIADNAGFDSAALVSELRAKHAEGHSTYGLDMEEGEVACMSELGI